MKTVTTLLILLSIALDTCKAQTINDPPFMLVDMRPTATPNLITLQCRRSSDASFESQAMYYLNGSNVNTVEGFVNLSEEPGTVRFIIQRRLEGEYSCGTLNQRSNSISFIAFPNSNPIDVRQPTYAVAGESISLQCGIEPGALVGQYFATWLSVNGTSSQTLYRYPSPTERQLNPSVEFTIDENRYGIDRNDLSLIIKNVQLSDSLLNYRCQLSVQDPRTNNVRFYALTQSFDIQLIVVEPPQILTTLSPNTIVRQNEDVVFRCVAQGYPAPTVSWTHAGLTVINNSPYFEVNSTVSREDLSLLITSYFVVRSVNASMNGEVKCTATPPQQGNIGGRILNKASTSTQLSVLGSFQSLEVQVTTESDVIIIVNLPRALVVPVNLILVYTNLDDPTQQNTRITEAAYLNTTAIQHIEFASQVVYDHFVLQVGLFSHNTRGILTRAPGEYDTDSPTIFEEIFSTNTIIIIGTVPASIVLIIATVVGLVLCVYFDKKFRMQQSEDKNNHDFRCLIANNTNEVLKELRAYADSEKDTEIRKEIIIAIKDIVLNQLKLCKTSKSSVTLGTQTSHATSRTASQQPSRQTSDEVDMGGREETDGPDIVQAESEMKFNEAITSDINPPDYDTLSDIDTSEQQLANLLAQCISEIVQASQEQGDNERVIETVESEIKGTMTERQMIELQEKHIGTPI